PGGIPKEPLLPRRFQARGCVMRRSLMISIFALLLPLAWMSSTAAARAAQPAEVKPRAGLTVWDTGRSSPEALTPAALAGKNDWTAVPLDRTADSFKGDAVLSNGRVVAVLRQQAPALELHSVRPDGAIARLQLRLLTAAGESAARLERVSLVENSRG